MTRDDDRVNAIVGENLRRLRTERAMTRVALAAKAGFDDSYLGKMERGERGTSSGGYQRLADALGVEVAALFAAPPPGGKRRKPPVKGRRPAHRRHAARLVRAPRDLTTHD